MKTKDNLLDKYYRGETSLEEEKELKNSILSEDFDSSEKDIFGFYSKTGNVPDDLEESLMNGLTENLEKKKVKRMWIYRISSAAAVLLIALTVSLNYRAQKNAEMESQFFVMEQALFQVSESIQPEEENEMLVLWVDENVEIIINE
ncbi:MAG: hypothetical protein ACOCWK_05905 [Tangfeifania sp.]